MINEYIPNKTYAIVTSYKNNKIVGIVAGAVINSDNTISLSFPVKNPFENNQKVTLHIDDRTGIEIFTHDLNVHRCSYKAVISNCTVSSALAKPVEFQLNYKHDIVESFNAPNYKYPVDNRENLKLPETTLDSFIQPNELETDNKLGVWSTAALERPHTTVMAFLSSVDDDIFLISHKDSLKSKMVNRDNSCIFAIDHRSSFHFEKAYEWNYTIIMGEAFSIPRSNKMFNMIQQQFIEKNPWEVMFFSNPDIEMYHIKPIEIICPTSL